MFTREEIQEAGLDDFRVFLRQVWDYLSLPKPTRVQNDIAKWLMAGDDRMILSAFRGVGKTWITVAFVLWHLFLNPEVKIMVVSASKQTADQFSDFAKQLIRGMPMLRHLEPRAHQADRSDYWTVGPARESKDPSVKSVGINGQLTGSRADIIVADDVEIPRNSQTYHLREQLATRVSEFSDVLKPGGTIIYLGTPQVEESLYMKLLQRGFRMRVWPSEIPEKPENYAGRLAPLIQKMVEQGAKPGTPTDPNRFNREELLKRRADKGLSGYALQFMLDVNPSAADKRPLKLRNLIVTDTDPDLAPIKLVWSQDRQYAIQELSSGGFDGDSYFGPAWASEERQKYGGTVMAIDPSGKGTDETAYAIMRYLQGTLYLVEVGGFLDGFSDETLEALATRAAHRKVNYVIAEENYGGGMFNSLLKPYLAKEYRLPDGTYRTGGKFDEDYNTWSRGAKELRILDTLEPVLANHRLVVDRSVIEADWKVQQETPEYSLVWQMTRMERLKGALPHEDRLEAVAMAAAYWTERMDRDRDKAMKNHRASLLEEELRKFKRGFNVLRPSKPGAGLRYTSR